MIRRATAHSSVRRWRAPVVASGAVLALALSACSGSAGSLRDAEGAAETATSEAGDSWAGHGASATPGGTPSSAPLSPPDVGPSTPAPTSTAPASPDRANPDPARSDPASPESPSPESSDPAEAGGAPDAEPEADSPATSLTAADERTLRRYAADTWVSMRAMVDEHSGLIADHIGSTLDDPSRYTSPTNIAGYLWSVVVVRDLGIISADESRARIGAALTGLASLERHGPSGMFYNWYSPQTGAKLTAWPDSDDPIEPFLSTVDNGWLAAALRIVSAAEPTLSAEADGIAHSMDFSWFFDPTAAAGAGLNRVGFWPDRPADECAEPADGSGTATGVFVSCASYGTTVSEARIATYVGIANGQLPESVYFAPSRTGAASGSGQAWMRTPQGKQREYDGVSVLESTYSYKDMRIVPSWGGSMFEALMPDLLVPEADWGPQSWGTNHRATVAAQKAHGVSESPGGYWGFSPAADPEGGYGEYGVSALSIRSTANGADANGRDATAVELPRSSSRFGGHGEDHADGPTDAVVTPHASFLALPYDPQGALDNLARLDGELGMYGAGGFFDAVDVETRHVAPTYLSLDQSMVLGAVGNVLDDGVLKRYLVDDAFEKTIRPLVAQQVFGATLG